MQIRLIFFVYIKLIIFATNKGEILRLLLEDCRLEGETLKYTIKKPFDKILNLTNQKRALKIEVENLKDFEAVSHNVKMLTTKLI